MTSGKGLKVAVLNGCLNNFSPFEWTDAEALLIFSAHNAVVTSAIFAPHPGLIVPQETGAEKPEAERKSLDSDDSETIPSGMFVWLHREHISRHWGCHFSVIK